MSNTAFWATIDQQLEEATAAAGAADVLRIFSAGRNPYGPGHSAGPFFAGSGGDKTLRAALSAAGWSLAWSKASYYYAMRAPDGSTITYVEGDLYPGTAQ
jgi:hypothetical protein